MALTSPQAKSPATPSSTGLQLTEPKLLACSQAVEQFMVRCDYVNMVMVAFRDGRPFVSRSRSDIEPGKFAAMSSSLMALGNTVLRELNAGTLDHLVVEGAQGKMVVAAVPASNGMLIIAVHSNADARLGLVLGHSKTCALAISTAIS